MPANRLRTKSSPDQVFVTKAPCEQGETAAKTDCTPASGSGGKFLAGADSLRWDGEGGSSKSKKAKKTKIALVELAKEQVDKLVEATGIKSWSADYILEVFSTQEFGKRPVNLSRDLQEQLKGKFSEVARSVGVEVAYKETGISYTAQWHDALSKAESDTLLDWVDAGTSQSTEQEDYQKMRDADHAGESSPELEALLKAMSKAPKFKGTAYRGLTLSEEDLSKVLAAGSMKLNGLSCFSKHKNIAESFAKGKGSVLIKAKLKDGRDLSSYNEYEAEVVIRRTELKVISSKKFKSGAYLLECEEI